MLAQVVRWAFISRSPLKLPIELRHYLSDLFIICQIYLVSQEFTCVCDLIVYRIIIIYFIYLYE